MTWAEWLFVVGPVVMLAAAIRAVVVSFRTDKER